MSTTTMPAAQPQFALGGARAWIVWTIAVTFVVWLFNVQTGYAIVNSSVQWWRRSLVFLGSVPEPALMLLY